MKKHRVFIRSLAVCMSTVAGLGGQLGATEEPSRSPRNSDYGTVVTEGSGRVYIQPTQAGALLEVEISCASFIGPLADNVRRLTYVVKLDGLPPDLIEEDVRVVWRWRSGEDSRYQTLLATDTATRTGDSLSQALEVAGPVRVVEASILLVTRAGGRDAVSQGWLLAAVPDSR